MGGGGGGGGGEDFDRLWEGETEWVCLRQRVWAGWRGRVPWLFSALNRDSTPNHSQPLPATPNRP